MVKRKRAAQWPHAKGYGSLKSVKCVSHLNRNVPLKIYMT